jgi:hypothetical protein
MSTTRKKIREQIQLKYNQYVDKNGFNDEVDVRIIDIDVEQSINKFLKPQVLEYFKNGQIEVPTCNIIEYTLPISDNTVSLPVFPLQLPMNMGVWRVVLENGDDAIPINTTMASLYSRTNTVYLEDQIGYTLSGLKIKFSKSTTGDAVVSLLVSDFSFTDVDDILPISPELEADIVSDVLDRISQGRISQPELNVKQNAN